MPLKYLNIKHFLALILVVALIIWILLLSALGIPLDINFETLKHIPTVLTVEGILGIVFTKWLWRWRIFSLLVPFPDLQGTWKGTLKSSWKKPGEGETTPPIPCYLIIRQSFLNISCVIMTNESKSHSCAASLLIDGETETKRLIYTYLNRPEVKFRERSEMHDGTTMLEISETKDGILLQGEYWTNRSTTGDISFKKHSDSIDINLPKLFK